MAKSRQQASLPGMNDEPGKRSPPGPPRAAPAATASRAGDVPALEGQTVYVVDANSLIFQVFHALPEMTSPRGEPVNAVYGFTRDMLFLLEEKRPNYLFCAFDMPGPTFRHELYTEYKAQRAEMPDDLVPQIPAIQQVLGRLAIPVVGVETYEADDVLATIAQLTEEHGGECRLVTADKDCRQLISDYVKIYNVRKDELFDAEKLAAEWNVKPEQVVDFQSLVGDAVDNVPGVPLIGPKIAGQLLSQYDTLEGVLEHADEVSGTKRKENLKQHREQALLSRRLVALDRHVPLELDWQAARVGGFDHAAGAELFAELGFRTFTEKMRSLDTSEAPAGWQATYHTVDTPAKLKKFLKALGAQTHVSIDTETTSKNPMEAELVGYVFAWDPGEAWYVPVRAPEGQPRLDPASTREALRNVLENAAVEKVGQNLKYDMVVLRRAGVDVRGVAFDTMVASYLLDAGARNHNLDELASRYLNYTTTKISELIGKGREQITIDQVDVDRVAVYAGEDADVALRLEPVLAAKLEEEGLTKLFVEVELPLIDVLVEMEFNGIRIDVERLAELSRQYGTRMVRLERDIYDVAGHEFNIASPKQLQTVLFEEQQLPVLKRTKTGASVDASVLEELAADHPLPAKIIEYRQYAKLKSTYVDALPQLVNPATGRVHTSFNQVVAATGRLSSSDPNLQNIPVRTERGREIRSAFLPRADDWSLLAADYSQIELRVLAHFSEDEELCGAFARGEDIHAMVASQVYGVPLAEVTPEMRRGAKAVNFGVVYGQSPFGLARQLGIDQDEAAEFIDAYFDRYPGVERFLSKVLEECRATGYVKTILGRKRSIRGVRPDAGRQRNLSERTAINTVVQGSAADLIKQAMIAVHGRLRSERRSARLLLQIHDELIFEVPSDELEQLADLVASEMTGVWSLRVPLEVEVLSGPNWAQLEPHDNP